MEREEQYAGLKIYGNTVIRKRKRVLKKLNHPENRDECWASPEPHFVLFHQYLSATHLISLGSSVTLSP